MIKEARYSVDMTCRSYINFYRSHALPPRWVTIAEGMSDNSPEVILRDDVLEGFVGYGFNRDNYEVGDGLGKCLGNDDIGLASFVTEVLYHRREHKLSKGLRWINMKELRKDRVGLIDRGCEVQSTFII